MYTKLILSVLFAAVSLAAQSPAPAVLDIDARPSLLRNPGLRSDGPDRLLGGGADYRVRFSRAGLVFDPALGNAVTDVQHLHLRAVAVRRGEVDWLDVSAGCAPRQRALSVRYPHAPHVEERFDLREDGVALSWHFDERPAGHGDLVVRYALGATLPAPRPTPDGGMELVLPNVGGVHIGGVTGIDANGVEVRGRLSYGDGWLEMSLPSDFVDEARLPLVLDPIIGTSRLVTPLISVSSQPEVAYDETTDRFLIVYQVPISSSNADLRAQLVNASGQPFGQSLLLQSNGIASQPHVANLPVRDRFGVVWTQQSGFVSSVEFVALNASNGTVTHSSTIASGLGVDLFPSVDIGSDTEAPIGSLRGFVIVYESDVSDAIEVQRISFSAQDTLQLFPSQAWANGGSPLFTSYTEPSIARAGGADRRLLLVARRSSLLAGASIVAGVVYSDGTLFSPTTTVVSSSTSVLSRPVAGGRDGRWLVAWEQESSGVPASTVAWRTVQLDAAGSSLVLGATESVGSSLTPASSPAIGFTPGRSWIGYRFRSLFPASTTVRAIAVDSLTGQPCNEVFSASTGTAADERPVAIATMASGGRTSGEDSLCVFDDGSDLYAQVLRNHGTGGSYTDLGGGCGGNANVAFSHPPGIGSSGLVCTLSGLPATSLFAIFNLSAPAATVPCGSVVGRRRGDHRRRPPDGRRTVTGRSGRLTDPRSLEAHHAVLDGGLADQLDVDAVALGVDPGLAVALLGQHRHHAAHVPGGEVVDERARRHPAVGLAQSRHAVVGPAVAQVVEQAAHQHGDQVRAQGPRRVDVPERGHEVRHVRVRDALVRPGLREVERLAVDGEVHLADGDELEPGRGDDDVRVDALAGRQPDAGLVEALDRVGHDRCLARVDRAVQVAVRDQAQPLIPRVVVRREVLLDHLVAERVTGHAEQLLAHLVGVGARAPVEERLQRRVLAARDRVRDTLGQHLAERVRDRVAVRPGDDVGGRALQHGDVGGVVGHRRHEGHRGRTRSDHHHSPARVVEVVGPVLGVDDRAAEALAPGELGCVPALVGVVPRAHEEERARELHRVACVTGVAGAGGREGPAGGLA